MNLNDFMHVSAFSTYHETEKPLKHTMTFLYSSIYAYFK